MRQSSNAEQDQSQNADYKHAEEQTFDSPHVPLPADPADYRPQGHSYEVSAQEQRQMAYIAPNLGPQTTVLTPQPVYAPYHSPYYAAGPSLATA